MPSILTHELFWKVLRDSGSTDHTRGMQLHTFTSGDATLRTFSKTHSYGEYIFDWAWAQGFERSGLPYYPKLTSMVPFTPATAAHFWGPTSHWPALLSQHDELLQRHSSAHFLFTTPEEQRFLGESGYLLRDSFQYHFINEGDADFPQFLNRLKAKKAKHIRREREFPGLAIERLTGPQLTRDHAREMYAFYRSTLEEKQAIAYLTPAFFELLFTTLPENVLYVRARDGERLLAGALFYYDAQRLYGRYWGALAHVPNLHFELCYYQGIEFCLEHKLAVFEAGAQGEHKIQRGFRPVLTASAHRINHAGFAKAIDAFVTKEREDVRAAIAELTQLLPFKAQVPLIR
jgi:predicted N-acyltransferase